MSCFGTKNGPGSDKRAGQCGPRIKKYKKAKKNLKISDFFNSWPAVSDQEAKWGEKKNSSSFLRRFRKIRRSEFVGPRTKVALLDEGYAWVPKTTSFTEGERMGVYENQDSSRILLLGFRRARREKWSRRRGLRVGTKNNEFHRRWNFGSWENQASSWVFGSWELPTGFSRYKR